MAPPVVAVAVTLSLILCIFKYVVAEEVVGSNSRYHRSASDSLCEQLIRPSGYPCSEHTIQTKDGYLLALQRVSSSRPGYIREKRGPPVLLQHGLFMAGDVWFLNGIEQSLGFILADNGFDVWVGNVRGTRWSHGHVSLSERRKKFWDWSWQDLALFDLAEMINYVNSTTNSKVFVVGHSQGTIMSLAAFTQPDIVKMVKAAALLCPITYLNHVNAPLVLRMVNMHIDQMILAMGIHQLNFRSDWAVDLLDSLCDGRDCNDLLNSVTGENCCFNNSLVEFFLEYEPHPSSSKNLHHLFQMIRRGAFSMYDYGIIKNLRVYGQSKPPEFDVSRIPKSLPLWIAYGGNDGLADVTDVKHTLDVLQSKPKLLYLKDYGHVDFVLSWNAKEDVYHHIINFFKSLEKEYSDY